jgi:hypothetical protein
MHASNAVGNPSHRPPWKGECRDYLARAAREIIERHCGVLTLPNLRRGIAAVLDAGRISAMLDEAEAEVIELPRRMSHVPA